MIFTGYPQIIQSWVSVMDANTVNTIIDVFPDAIIPLTECGCWIWMKPLDRTGYGRIRAPGQKVRLAVQAHRLSWTITNGPIPNGLKVCHSCDIRCCVNPDHLFVGTQAENMADMSRKGRASIRRGTESHFAKLKHEDVLFILSSDLPYADLTRKFGVSDQTVYRIRSGRGYRDIYQSHIAGAAEKAAATRLRKLSCGEYDPALRSGRRV